MPSPLFCEGIVEDLRLQPLLGIHLLEPGVLDPQLLEPGYHGRIHTAVLGPLLIKRHRADPKPPIDLGNRHAGLNSLQSL